MGFLTFSPFQELWRRLCGSTSRPDDCGRQSVQVHTQRWIYILYIYKGKYIHPHGGEAAPSDLLMLLNIQSRPWLCFWIFISGIYRATVSVMCETGGCQREIVKSDEPFTSLLPPTASPNLSEERNNQICQIFFFFFFCRLGGHWRARARMQTDHATRHLPVTSSPLVAAFSSAGRCVFIRAERLASQGLRFRFAIRWRRPQALTTWRAAIWLMSKPPPPP